jgi:hypothetical protein
MSPPTLLGEVENEEQEAVMAEASTSGQYVKLTVQLWYDRSTNRVHLTSNDPDLPKAGIHTNFKPGSQADQSARALLAKFGKLPEGAE